MLLPRFLRGLLYSSYYLIPLVKCQWFSSTVWSSERAVEARITILNHSHHVGKRVNNSKMVCKETDSGHEPSRYRTVWRERDRKQHMNSFAAEEMIVIDTSLQWNDGRPWLVALGDLDQFGMLSSVDPYMFEFRSWDTFEVSPRGYLWRLFIGLRSVFCVLVDWLVLTDGLLFCLNPFSHTICSVSFSQPSQKTFRTKRTLAKKQRQNRPLPHWIRLRTDNSIKWNAKRRHWRRTKLGL